MADKKMISVFGSDLGNLEVEQVTESIRNQWVGMGSKVKAFEQSMMTLRKLPNFLMVNSGSNALYMALYLLDLPKGSEVILPAFNWIACANAVVLCGCQPVFCDVDADSQNVTAETIKPHISAKTSAILIVHYGGKAVDMDPIMELGFPVVEDAAHAVDTMYKGKYCGGIGTSGVYSFDAIKNLATGEAGGITFQDSAMYERASKLRYCGIEKSGFQQAHNNSGGRWWEYELKEVFHKMLPTDLSAGLGLAQLQSLPELQRKRKAIWDKYQDAFGSRADIKSPVNALGDETHSYFTYLIQVDRRDELAHYLLDKGIYTTLRYHPLHLYPIYDAYQELPVTEMLNERGLNIPLHPGISAEDTDYIIDSILNFYS